MRHVDYREWASEALDDRRQVYARDVRERDDAPLRFMAPGEAVLLRGDARAGRLICPLPGCPWPALTTRGPAERRHRFVRRQAPADSGHGRAYARRVSVRLLREWLDDQSAGFEISEDVVIDGASVTLLVRSPDSGRRVALVYVGRRFGAEAWFDHARRLRAAGITAAWIFALRPMFFALPEPSAAALPGDPVREDRDRGALVLDPPVYRAMRSAGAWPLLLSLERQELANLVLPGSGVAARLGLVRRCSPSGYDAAMVPSETPRTSARGPNAPAPARAFPPPPSSNASLTAPTRRPPPPGEPQLRWLRRRSPASHLGHRE
jgi:hypothetical protein